MGLRAGVALAVVVVATVAIPAVTPFGGTSRAVNGSISGFVTAADTGLGVRATVFLCDESNACDFANTDQDNSGDGDYSFPDVAPGTYTIEFSPDSPYAPQFWEGEPTRTTAEPFVLGDGEDAVVNAVLQVAPTIFGTVTSDDGGTPLEGVRVWARGATSGATYSATTDASGAFARTLPFDTYTVEFSTLGTPAFDHQREFWNDQLTLAAADPIDLTTTVDVDVSSVLHRLPTLTGVVTDDAGTPLRDVLVRVDDADGPFSDAIFTDESGRFLIPVVESDIFVTFQPPEGYRQEYYDDVVDFNARTFVDTTSGADVDLGTIDLLRLTPLSGSVTDPDSAAVANVQVRACPVGSIFGCTTVFTDAAGDYQLFLEPGSYEVRFFGLAAGYADQWWNGAATADDATPVEVTFLVPVTGIDAQLSDQGVIAGTVTAAFSGQPLPDRTVSVCGPEFCSNTTTDAAGEYSQPVSPGTYTVVFVGDSGSPELGKFMSESWNSQPDLGGVPDEVEVTAGEIVTGIDASLERYGQIAGQVTDGGTPVPAVEVSAFSSLLGSGSGVVTDADGNYVISLPPASDYTVNVSPEIQFPTQIRDVVVTEGSSTTLDVTVGSAGSISGIVTGPGGAPVANIRVLAIPVESGPTVGQATTDADGRYTIGRLAAGDWHVEFGEAGSGYAITYYDDAPGRDTATPVSVELGADTGGIDAQLQLAGAFGGTVTGTTGPIESALVEACLGSACFTEFTDATGRYDFAGLVPGEYDIEFDPRDGVHAAEYWNGATAEVDASPLLLGGGTTLDGIDAVVEVGGTISGFASESTGRGLVPGEVAIEACSETVGRCEGAFPDLGLYTISALAPADDYLVSFSSSPFDPENPVYVSEWWCDAETAGGAVALEIGIGEAVTGIDASLREIGAPDHDTCDADGDTVPDPIDNCPATANSGQANNDGDAFGDVCDPDDDNDGVNDGPDNCPKTANANQRDADGDGAGDACDASPLGDDVVVSIAPERLIETRDTPLSDTVDREFEADGPIAAGRTYRVQIAGRGSVPLGATAAVLNLTTVLPQAAGFLTIHPCLPKLPLASSINYAAGEIVNNEVITKLSASGEICIFASATTHLVADASGYAPGVTPYRAIDPARIVETRDTPLSDTVDRDFEADGPIGAGRTYQVLVAGRGGVDSDAVAAVLNLTTVVPAAAGFLTIHPCLPKLPLASSINYAAGAIVNNEVITKLSASGHICIYSSARTDLVIDAVGSIGASSYTPIDPARIVETRDTPLSDTVDRDFEADGPIGAGRTYKVLVAGRGGIPDDATTAVMNLTTVVPQAAGFLTIHPCLPKPPLASSINYAAGAIVNNEVITKLSATGHVCIFASAATHLVVDAVGHA